MRDAAAGGTQRDDVRAAALLAGVPALLALPVAVFAEGGPRGVFLADVAGLAAVAAAAAWLARGTRLGLGAAAAACALLALPHLVAGGTLGGLPALLALAAGCAAGASGLAALGRRLGAPALTAGLAGAGVLWIAMTGIRWADPLAESLPRERRPAFRQAVVHLDPATACAYDAAGFDRFHEARTYREVPLAASLVSAPSALPTGAAWFVLGLLAWAAAALLPAARPSVS